MRIKNIKVYFLKKKKYESAYPRPTFYRQGFVFIKLISEDNHEGFGEPSPYITDPVNLIKIIEKTYLKYFQNKKINTSFVARLKKNCQNSLLNSLLPAFDQAIFEIFSKEKISNIA